MKKCAHRFRAPVAMKMMQTATVILHEFRTMFWTPCDRRQPAESEGHFCCARQCCAARYVNVHLISHFSCNLTRLTSNNYNNHAHPTVCRTGIRLEFFADTVLRLQVLECTSYISNIHRKSAISTRILTLKQ